MIAPQILKLPALAVLLAASILAVVGGPVNSTGAPPTGKSASSTSTQPLPAALVQVTQNNEVTLAGPAAEKVNAARPLLVSGLELAAPFSAAAASLASRDLAALCLAQAMYYEAGFEGEAGRLAVAQVVLNRVRHPAFPKSVCGVVFQKSLGGTCQFTFACDGSMGRPPAPAVWAETLKEARAMLAGRVTGAVGMATHYHADYVLPAWAPQLDKIAVIGRHIFYRWPNGWGRRAAFTGNYAGTEKAGLLVETNKFELAVDAAAAAEMAVPMPPRSDADVGGYLDTSKGWSPSFTSGNSDAAPVDPGK